MSWHLQEAKQKFSKLVQCALKDVPQVVTRHGEEVVVVLSIDTFRHLQRNIPDFKDFLFSAPGMDDLERSKAPAPSSYELPARHKHHPSP